MGTSFPLRAALLANAAFSAGSGLILIINPGFAGSLLGFAAPWIFRAVGVGLAIFAVDLVHQATRPRMATWRALYASLGDLLWVLGTFVGVALFRDALSESGLITVLGVAAVVMIFGVWQVWGVKRVHRAHRSGMLRHCVLVNVNAPPDAMWSVVRRIGDIKEYMPALQSSMILDDRSPGAGAVRQCSDHSGKTWSEECTWFDDSARRFDVRFRAEDPGFPFPAESMLGGWHVTPAEGGGSDVMVWWELQPRPRLLGPVLLPMLAFQADRDFPNVIRRMADDALGRDRNSSAGKAARPAVRLAPRAC